MNPKQRLTAYRWALWRLEDIAYNIPAENAAQAEAKQHAKSIAHDGMLFVRDARAEGDKLTAEGNRIAEEAEFLRQFQEAADRLVVSGIDAHSPVEYSRGS